MNHTLRPGTFHPPLLLSRVSLAALTLTRKREKSRQSLRITRMKMNKKRNLQISHRAYRLQILRLLGRSHQLEETMTNSMMQRQRGRRGSPKSKTKKKGLEVKESASTELKEKI